MIGYMKHMLDCKNVQGQFPHHIQIPSPTIAPQLTGQAELTSRTDSIFFGCPECGHVAGYQQSDRKYHQSQTDKNTLPDNPLGVRISFVCAEEGCEAPITLYTSKGENENEEQVLRRLQKGVFHRECVCSPDGHKIHLPRRHVVDVRVGEQIVPFYFSSP